MIILTNWFNRINGILYFHKDYYISVSDPWDFAGPDGENIIEGKVIKAVSNSCLIFKSNHTLDFKGGSGNVFILTPRHSGQSFKDWQTAGDVSVNGSLLINGYESLSEVELLKKSKFVMIGSIRYK